MPDLGEETRKATEELNLFQRAARAAEKDVTALRKTWEKAGKALSTGFHGLGGAAGVGYVGYQSATGQKNLVTAFRDVSVEFKAIQVGGEGVAKTFDKVGDSVARSSERVGRATKGFSNLVRVFTNEQKGFAEAIEALGKSSSGAARAFTGMTRVMAVATNPVVTAISAVTLAYDLMAERAIKAHKEINKQAKLTKAQFDAAGQTGGGYAVRAAQGVSGVGTTETLKMMGMGAQVGLTGQQTALAVRSAQGRARIEGKEIAKVIREELQLASLATFGMEKSKAEGVLREISYKRGGYIAPLNFRTDLGKGFERAGAGFLAAKEGLGVAKSGIAGRLGIDPYEDVVFARKWRAAKEVGDFFLSRADPIEQGKRLVSGVTRGTGALAGSVGELLAKGGKREALATFGGSSPAGPLSLLFPILNTFDLRSGKATSEQRDRATEKYFRSVGVLRSRESRRRQQKIGDTEAEIEKITRRIDYLKAEEKLGDTTEFEAAQRAVGEAEKSGDSEQLREARERLVRESYKRKTLKEARGRGSVTQGLISPDDRKELEKQKRDVQEVLRGLEEEKKKDDSVGFLRKYGQTKAEMVESYQRDVSPGRIRKNIMKVEGELREEQAKLEALREGLAGKGVTGKELETALAGSYRSIAAKEFTLKGGVREVDGKEIEVPGLVPKYQQLKGAISRQFQVQMQKAGQEILGESMRQLFEQTKQSGLLSNEDIREIQREVGRGGETDYVQASEVIQGRVAQARQRSALRRGRFAERKGIYQQERALRGAVIGSQARQLARVGGMTVDEYNEIAELSQRTNKDALDNAEALLNLAKKRHLVERAIVEERKGEAKTAADIKGGLLSGERAVRMGIIRRSEFQHFKDIGGQRQEFGLAQYLRSEDEDARQTAQQILNIREQMYQDEIDFAVKHSRAMMQVVQERYKTEQQMTTLGVSAADRRMAPAIGFGGELWGLARQGTGILGGAMGIMNQQMAEARQARSLREGSVDLRRQLIGAPMSPIEQRRRMIRAQREAEDDFARQKTQRKIMDEQQRKGFLGVFEQLRGEGVSLQDLRGAEGGRGLLLQMMQGTQGAWTRAGQGQWINKEMQELLRQQRQQAARRYVAAEEVRSLGARSIEEQVGVMEKRTRKLKTRQQRDQAGMQLAGKYREAAEYYAEVGDVEKTREYREKFEDELSKLPDHLKAVYNDKQSQMNIHLELSNRYLAIIAEGIGGSRAVAGVNVGTGVDESVEAVGQGGETGKVVGGFNEAAKMQLEAAKINERVANTPIKISLTGKGAGQYG